MKSFLLGLLLLASVPMFSSFEYSPAKEILGISFVETVHAQEPSSVIHLEAVSVEAAKEAVTEETVKPYFDFAQSTLYFLTKQFPTVGPMIQAATEIIGGLASFFTLLSVFVMGVLRLPWLVAKFSNSQKWVDKIQKWSDTILPLLQKLSIFNVQKKK